MADGALPETLMRSTPTRDAGKEVTGAKSKKRPSRENTTMIAGNFKIAVSLKLHALVARLGVERGHRVSVQDALREMLIDYFRKHGETPPADLTDTDGNPEPAAPAVPARRSGRLAAVPKK
jgi:hypothetical protein